MRNICNHIGIFLKNRNFGLPWASPTLFTSTNQEQCFSCINKSFENEDTIIEVSMNDRVIPTLESFESATGAQFSKNKMEKVPEKLDSDNELEFVDIDDYEALQAVPTTKETPDNRYCHEIKIPIFPIGFVPDQTEYKIKFHKRLDENLIEFRNEKQDIIKKHNLLGKWFGFWLDDDGKQIVKIGMDDCVSSKCPIYAIISYGLKNDQTSVYVERPVYFFSYYHNFNAEFASE